MSDPSLLIQSIYQYSTSLKVVEDEFEDEKARNAVRKLLSLLLSRTEHSDIKGLATLIQTASLDIDCYQFGKFLYFAMRQYYMKWPELAGSNRTAKNWIQCSNCSRWRIVSAPESAMYSGNEKWFCSLNRDLLFADCRLPEEFPDSEIDPRKPIPFSVFIYTRYYLTKEAIECLIESGSGITSDKAGKSSKTLSVKRELCNSSSKKTRKVKKTKLLLRSQLPKAETLKTDTTTTTTETLPLTSTATMEVSSSSNISGSVVVKSWKALDEVNVLWMNGEEKEAVIVGAPNKGDAFLIKLSEDEDQMYTIKSERIRPRSSLRPNESQFMVDEFPIYEADTPFTKNTNTTISNTTSATSTVSNKQIQESPKETIQAKPNDLSELLDYDEDRSEGNKWDYEEEGRLLIAIEKFGFAWEKVSDYVGSKSVQECKDRWKFHAKMLSEFVHQPTLD